MFMELEGVVIYLFTNQHTKSLLSSLLTLYWKQPSDMSSVVLEPGGRDGDWRGIGRRLSREQLLWLGKLAKAGQRQQQANKSLDRKKKTARDSQTVSK